MWLKKTVELGNQLKPYIYAAPLTHTALWQGRILKTWKNLHKDKYEENLREYHPHIIILMKKSIWKKFTNDIYVYMKISIKTFLYTFTDFSPMSKYMLFLTLFPAPTCVSWVTFFIIKEILSRYLLITENGGLQNRKFEICQIFEVRCTPWSQSHLSGFPTCGPADATQRWQTMQFPKSRPKVI